MNISNLIDEIELSNMNQSDLQKVKMKPELICITKRQVLEIALIAQSKTVDKKLIRDTLTNFRHYGISNEHLAEVIQEKLIANIKN